MHGPRVSFREDGKKVLESDAVSHRKLRSYTTFLVVLGWVHVGAGALAGLAPWVLAAGQAIPADAAWEPWLLYAAPPLGLLVGALSGLGYFILSGVLRVLLDQRDLLEDLVQTQRRLLQVAEARQAGSPLAATDPFDLSDAKDPAEPTL
jgi:hypothetical protein